MTRHSLTLSPGSTPRSCKPKASASLGRRPTDRRGRQPATHHQRGRIRRALRRLTDPSLIGADTRHRLNRGGNRHANCALHRIAVVRLHTDARTRAYANRKRATGKTNKEILRCLKRAIAREVYHLITDRHRPTPADTAGLRADPRRSSPRPALLDRHTVLHRAWPLLQPRENHRLPRLPHQPTGRRLTNIGASVDCEEPPNPPHGSTLQIWDWRERSGHFRPCLRS